MRLISESKAYIYYKHTFRTSKNYNENLQRTTKLNSQFVKILIRQGSTFSKL